MTFRVTLLIMCFKQRSILLAPTPACNMHCTGCWAAEYGNLLNLSLETIDSIICQGKVLGTYMYTRGKDDAAPCVFIHYSNCNIPETTLLDAIKSPIFMAYHDNQPLNKNMLRPCPMLENPKELRTMVKPIGAVSTDYESPERVDHLCDKTTPYTESADIFWVSCGKKM